MKGCLPIRTDFSSDFSRNQSSFFPGKAIHSSAIRRKFRHENMQKKTLILILLAFFLVIPAVHAEDALEWTTRGQASLDAGDYAGALNYFNNALALDKNYASALAGKAVALDALQDYTNALSAANQALAIRSLDQNALSARAFALFKLQDYNGSVTAYDTLFTVQINHPDAYCNQGYAYMQLNRAGDAITPYKQCTLLDPLNIMAWNNLGLAYMAQGDYDHALSAYDEATSVSVKNATVWNNKGEALMALNRPADALQSFNKAIGIDPGYTTALKNRDAANGQLQVFNVSFPTTPVPTISRIGTFYTTPTPVPAGTTEEIEATPEQTSPGGKATTAPVAKKTTYSALSPLTALGAVAVIAGAMAMVRKGRK